MLKGRSRVIVQEREAQDVRLHRRRHRRDEPRVRNLPHYESDIPRTTRAAGKSQSKLSNCNKNIVFECFKLQLFLTTTKTYQTLV